MGEVNGRTAAGAGTGPAAAAPVAWGLAAAAIAVAAGLAVSVPADVPVLRGLPQVAAWASVVVLALSLAAGGQRVAPFAAVADTMAVAAALVARGGPVGATAVGVGVAGWVCLELTSSSLESRARRRRSASTVLRRLGEGTAVAVGGAVVGVAALTVATGTVVEDAALRSAAVLAAVALLGLVAWLASDVVDRE